MTLLPDRDAEDARMWRRLGKLAQEAEVAQPQALPTPFCRLAATTRFELDRALKIAEIEAQDGHTVVSEWLSRALLQLHGDCAALTGRLSFQCEEVVRLSLENAELRRVLGGMRMNVSRTGDGMAWNLRVTDQELAEAHRLLSGEVQRFMGIEVQENDKLANYDWGIVELADAAPCPHCNCAAKIAAENAELRRVLAMLWDAKQRKENRGKDAEYEAMKDAAWEACRRLLAGGVEFVEGDPAPESLAEARRATKARLLSDTSQCPHCDSGIRQVTVGSPGVYGARIERRICDVCDGEAELRCDTGESLDVARCDVCDGTGEVQE